MSANTDLERVVRDLFEPVEQSLNDLQEDRQAYAQAQETLQEAVDQLDAAAEDEWLAVARLMNDLLEIAGCAADEAGETDALADDIRAGVSLLRDAMLRSEGSTGELSEFAASARSQWASYLELLSDDDWSDAADHAEDAFATELDDAPGNSAEETATVDVQMILQAVSGGSPPKPAAETETVVSDAAKAKVAAPSGRSPARSFPTRSRLPVRLPRRLRSIPTHSTTN